MELHAPDSTRMNAGGGQRETKPDAIGLGACRARPARPEGRHVQPNTWLGGRVMAPRSYVELLLLGRFGFFHRAAALVEKVAVEVKRLLALVNIHLRPRPYHALPAEAHTKIKHTT